MACERKREAARGKSKEPRLTPAEPTTGSRLRPPMTHQNMNTHTSENDAPTQLAMIKR